MKRIVNAIAKKALLLFLAAMVISLSVNAASRAPRRGGQHDLMERMLQGKEALVAELLKAGESLDSEDFGVLQEIVATKINPIIEEMGKLKGKSREEQAERREERKEMWKKAVLVLTGWVDGLDKEFQQDLRNIIVRLSPDHGKQHRERPHSCEPHGSGPVIASSGSETHEHANHGRCSVSNRD